MTKQKQHKPEFKARGCSATIRKGKPATMLLSSRLPKRGSAKCCTTKVLRHWSIDLPSRLPSSHEDSISFAILRR